MAESTSIEWADATANFWEGCTQVSPACDNCYAKARAERYGTVEWNGPPRQVKAGVKVVRAMQKYALLTGETPFVFVNSLSDFFDNQADETWRLWAVQEIMQADKCIFLLLTKRIGNVIDMVNSVAGSWPDNAWLGITVINQAEADRDIPKLLAAKGKLKIPKVFLSIEPMLGPIDLERIPFDKISPEQCGAEQCCGGQLYGNVLDQCTAFCDGPCDSEAIIAESVDWVIVGGESGKEARPMHPDWARSLRNQCAAAEVPFMFKQWGEWRRGDYDHGERFGIAPDETMVAPSGKFGRYNLEEAGQVRIKRYGKKLAGRLLNGVEHNERPKP